MSRILRVAPLLLVGMLALDARAEDEREARARVLQSTGATLFQAGELLRARTAFAAAQALAPERANPYRWLGLVDAQLGRCGDALPNLETFLTKAAPDDPRAAEVIATRDRCKRILAGDIAAAAPAVAGSAAAPATTSSRAAASAGSSGSIAAPAIGGAPTAPLSITATPSTAPVARRPVHKQWWLWTIVGAVAVGGALGIGFGVAATGGPAQPFDPVHVR